MPDGQTHYKYFKKGYLWNIPSSLILVLVDWRFGLGNLVGYSLHRYLDNDLDIMGTNLAEGRQVNELPVLGHIMFGISSAYGSIFRRYHRSFITHFPFVSTFIRLCFFGAIPLLVADNLGINLIGNGWHKFWIGLWVGLSQADAIHWALDKKFGGD